MVLKKFRKEEVLFREDEECRGVGIMISGRIKIVSYSFSGKEIIYNRLGDGEMFGANLVFSSEKQYRGNVVGETAGSFLYIGKEALVKLLQTNREFLLLYLEHQSNFGKEMNLKNKILSFGTAEERLDYYLHVSGGEIEIESIADLSRKLGLERETLSRLIHSLDSKGKILYESKRIKLL
ncbi:MAG: Crp/Fnr family transcriptional regulator [Bacilli bacterium]|nr:Crp/Fnr family transcriptional regulator [Bacilli bacterium]